MQERNDPGEAICDLVQALELHFQVLDLLREAYSSGIISPPNPAEKLRGWWQREQAVLHQIK